MHLFDLLQNEYKISPMYSCLTVGKFCMENVMSAYKRQGKEPPKELTEFLAAFPKLVSEQEAFMTEQYLQLNTEGTS